MLIRQTTVSTVAGVAFLVIALLLGGGVWFATQTIAQERSAVARQAQFKQLGYDLANASDFLTDECRKYVVSTDPQHLQDYWNEINVTKTRDNVLTRLKSLGATADELALVDEAKHNSDALVGTETRAQRLTLEAGGTPEAAMPPAIASFKLDQADESLRPADKMAAARRMMFDAQYEHDKSIIMGPITEFQDKMNARAAHEAEAAKGKTRAALTLLVVLAFLIPAGIGTVLWVYQTQLGVPVANYIAALQGRQEGDQDFALVPHGTEELRSLAGTFNEQFQANQRQISRNQALIGSLQALVGQITEDAQSLMRASAGLASSTTEIGTATHEISTTMREVACASEQSARGAGEVAQGNAAQAQALSQGTDLVKRLSETVQGVAHDAAMATQAAAQADQVAGAGADVVRQSVDGMARIRSTVTESSEVVRILGEASARIGGIVQTIDEIAGQTNLLALNAAIEAARAGDAGRGFAVVADEVRKLAERSGVATKQIGQLIEQVQTRTQEAVTAMAIGMREVETGTDLAEQAGRALTEIQSVVRSVTERVGGIGTAAAEMTVASDEVTRAITDVAAVVEESSAAAEEMSACAEEVSASVQTVAGTTVQQSSAVQGMVASAEELAAIAQRLQNAVAQFGSGESFLNSPPQQAPGDRLTLRRAA